MPNTWTGISKRSGDVCTAVMSCEMWCWCWNKRDDVCVKPSPHQQQCPSNIVECYKLNDSFDNVECCFDIVAVFGNNIADFGNNFERNFILSTKSRQIEHVQFVSTLSKGRNFTIESFDIVAVCVTTFDGVLHCLCPRAPITLVTALIKNDGGEQ